jgi:hypothetical protein
MTHLKFGSDVAQHLLVSMQEALFLGVDITDLIMNFRMEAGEDGVLHLTEEYVGVTREYYEKRMQELQELQGLAQQES